MRPVYRNHSIRAEYIVISESVKDRKMDKWPMTKQVMFATYYILLFDFKII